MAPEVSTEPISTPEPTATPTETPQATPAATPEATIQPTEEPAATEIPNANSAGNALAEGNAMTFGDVNETVTAKDVINLRSTPYTGDEGNVVGQLKNGETLVVSDHGPCVQDSGKTVEPESCQHSGRQSDRICGL